MRIQFTSPKSRFPLFAWLISWFEGTPYNHVRILLNGFIIEANRFGVQVYNVDRAPNVNIHHEYEMYGDLDDTETLEVIHKYINLPYSFSQILLIAKYIITGIRLPYINGSRAFICSELVASILEDYYLFKFPSSIDYLTPKGLKEVLDSHCGNGYCEKVQLLDGQIRQALESPTSPYTDEDMFNG